MLLEIMIGDPSGDGHDKVSTAIFELSKDMTEDEIYSHFEKASEVFGYNLTEYCFEYEDDKIPVELAIKLNDLMKSQGLKGIWEVNYRLEKSEDLDKDGVQISGIEYMQGYSCIFNTLDKDIQMKEKEDGIVSIFAEGYGLFD